MTEAEININKYAQSLLSESEIMIWFDGLELSQQNKTFDSLVMCFQQAHPTQEQIEQAIVIAPIKETMTPCVLLRTHSFINAIRKVKELPESELRKSTIILLSIFKIADTKRRETHCKNGCSHEWHNLNHFTKQ